MRFLNNEMNFFTPYGEDARTLLEDLSYVVGDFAEAFMGFIQHLRDFVSYSLPITLAVISLNSSFFLLLSLPVAQQLLALNIPIVLVLSLFALPAVYSLGSALLELTDMIVSPTVAVLKIVSNLAASLVESIASIDFDELNFDLGWGNGF